MPLVIDMPGWVPESLHRLPWLQCSITVAKQRTAVCRSHETLGAETSPCFEPGPHQPLEPSPISRFPPPIHCSLFRSALKLQFVIDDRFFSTNTI